MSRCAKTWIALFAVVLLPPAAYLLTFGRCFLPAPDPSRLVAEPMEMRTYAPFELPLQSDNMAGSYARIRWRFTRPGQARLFAASRRLSATKGQSDELLQGCLESSGYEFPPGCGASAGGDPPRWSIWHYPSMLNRIQADLRLRSTWTNALGPDGEVLRDASTQRTGASH